MQRNSPRIPDQAGVVDAITFEWIVLDGERLDLDPYVEVVSSYDRSLTVPLIETNGTYIHLGQTQDKKVTWISVLGTPFGDPPRVLYVGSIQRGIGQKRFVLEDGTVLETSDSEIPGPGQRIRALIDPVTDLVVEITPN